MKKIIFSVISIILVFIGLTFLISFFIINNGNFLTNFKFKSVTNAGLNYYVYFDNVKAATNYDVIVYDSENIIVYKENINKNSLTIKFDSLKYQETYKIVVIAYDKEGNTKSIKKPYSFMWDSPNFSEDNSLIMDNNYDYVVNLFGNIKEKDYILNVKQDDNIIDTLKITKEDYTIKNNLFKDKKTMFTLEILDESLVIAKINLFNLMSPISNIIINKPSNGDMINYDDVNLSFTGGENASNYMIEIYNDKKLIRRKEIENKNIILSSNLFEKASTYNIKIIASYYDYLDYSKMSEISFTMNAKDTLKPVYINVSPKNIIPGTKITLNNISKNAKIYYTSNGDNPDTQGILYTDGITINKDTTIKAIAKEEKKNSSIVTTFDFKVTPKNKYKVYLSPSNQYNNLGISSTGYTTEKKEMNDLADYVEKRLEYYGVTVYRNTFGDINRWTADSTYLGVDLHLALHSNASEDHTSYGIETWINDSSDKTYSLAQMIQNNLINIYYNKDDGLANRGVKYASGSLGEVNTNYVPFGILIEVAHHDYELDAKWIMDNKEKIANTIADTVLEYFQIK